MLSFSCTIPTHTRPLGRQPFPDGKFGCVPALPAASTSQGPATIRSRGPRSLGGLIYLIQECPLRNLIGGVASRKLARHSRRLILRFMVDNLKQEP